jgi:hypothetical protein
MTTFEIIINSMATVPVSPTEPSYVVQIKWTYKGTNAEYSSTINDSVFYQVNQETNYIPYEDLTQAIVSSWIQNYYSVDQWENMKDCIEDQIAMQINQPVTPQEQPLPWN